MSEQQEPRSPGRRRALRVLAGGAIAATSFMTGRATAPSGEQSTTQTQSQTAKKDKGEVIVETVDLSFKDFVKLSHKEQDQKLASLKGKNLNLTIDTDSTLSKRGSSYYKDGEIKWYKFDDKTPVSERGQLVAEAYYLSADQYDKTTTGMRTLDISVVFPVSVSGAATGKDASFKGQAGFYTYYPEYSKEFKEANYKRENMELLWRNTEQKRSLYGEGKNLPNGTVLKLNVGEGLYRSTRISFLDSSLPSAANTTK